jgi:hypothetical protein
MSALLGRWGNYFLKTLSSKSKLSACFLNASLASSIALLYQIKKKSPLRMISARVSVGPGYGSLPQRSCSHAYLVGNDQQHGEGDGQNESLPPARSLFLELEIQREDAQLASQQNDLQDSVEKKFNNPYFHGVLSGAGE